jgi:hypothetical protein
MTPEQEKEFEDKLKESLEKARIQGLGIGAKAISKVIYDKVVNVNRDCTKNDLLRVVRDIKKFCETGLAIKPEDM